MAGRRLQSGSSRNTLALVIVVAGALLLLLVPVILLFYALSDPKDAQIPGTLVILSVVSGMALVVVGAALRED